MVADGACSRMSASMVLSRAGSWLATNASAVDTALRQEFCELSTHVSITWVKPASLPPAVTLTSVVVADSAESWPLITSSVVAPEQAAKLNEAGALASAHSRG